MSFLKNIDNSNYNLNNLTYKTFICKDCTKKDKDKEYEIIVNDNSPKDLKNFGYISINYMKNPFVYVTTPLMVCLFGVNKNTNNMSLQFSNYKENNEMLNFLNFIKNVEFSQMKYLNLSEDDTDLYISQIKYDKAGKYDPNLC